MIPKIIHYCWFGGKEKPKSVVKCMDSWKKYCPDYEIKEWNENNFDVHLNTFVEQAYQSGKWAFVSDVARLCALVEYGGIYMDTDVELVKSLDDFLDNKAVSGFEIDHIMSGFMACEKDFPLFKEFLDDYKDKTFIKEDGSFDMVPNVVKITETCAKYGFVPNDTYQVVNGFALYPHDYFSPKDHNDGKIYKTENTVAIHHYAASWTSRKSRFRTKLAIVMYAVLGHKITDALRRKFGNKK